MLGADGGDSRFVTKLRAGKFARYALLLYRVVFQTWVTF